MSSRLLGNLQYLVFFLSTEYTASITTVRACSVIAQVLRVLACPVSLIVRREKSSKVIASTKCYKRALDRIVGDVTYGTIWRQAANHNVQCSLELYLHLTIALQQTHNRLANCSLSTNIRFVSLLTDNRIDVFFAPWQFHE